MTQPHSAQRNHQAKDRTPKEFSYQHLSRYSDGLTGLIEESGTTTVERQILLPSTRV